MKSRQNQIATSRFSLPASILFALLVCLLGGIYQNSYGLPMAVLALSTFLMVEFNNQHALLRIYSRMVSCGFLWLSCICVPLLNNWQDAFFQTSFIAYLLTIFHAYQDRKAVRITYLGFLFIGIASLFYIQILFLLPLLWLIHTTNVLAMSFKSFLASILGVITPYWFWGAYLLYQQSPQVLWYHCNSLFVFQPISEAGHFTVYQTVTWTFTLVLYIIGTLHFWRDRLNDKIRTRMIYNALIVLNVVLFVLLILQPHLFAPLMKLIIVCTSPLIAHFLALSHTRISNITFFTLLFVSLLITAFQLWIH